MSAILAGLVRKNHDRDHNINWDSFRAEKVISIEGNENVNHRYGEKTKHLVRTMF